jgi:hypothetical protein
MTAQHQRLDGQEQRLDPQQQRMHQVSLATISSWLLV